MLKIFKKDHGGSSDANQENGDDKRKNATGFICPTCMKQFSNAEILQKHFDSAHGNDEDGSGETSSSQSLLLEINDLKKSLTEEKWFSAELKKENDLLTTKLSKAERVIEASGGNAIDIKDELFLCQQQLKASEESRIMITTQVRQLFENVEKLNEENKSLSENANDARTQLAINNQHLIKLESESSVVVMERDNLKVQIIDLKDQLQCAKEFSLSGSEDTAMLKSENRDLRVKLEDIEASHSIQIEAHNKERAEFRSIEARLQNELAKAKEQLLMQSETRSFTSNELSSKTIALQEKLTEKDAELIKLIELIQNLKMERDSLSRSKKDADETVHHVQARLEQLEMAQCQQSEQTQIRISELDSARQNSEARAREAVHQARDYQEQMKDLENRLAILQREVECKSSSLDVLKEKFKELKEIARLSAEELQIKSNEQRLTLEDLSNLKCSAAQLTTELSKLQAERQELLVKLENGDSVLSTAMQQLIDERDLLKQRLSILEISSYEEISLSKKKVEELSSSEAGLKKQLADLNEALIVSGKEMIDLNRIVSDLRVEESSLRSRCREQAANLDEQDELIKQQAQQLDLERKHVQEVETRLRELHQVRQLCADLRRELDTEKKLYAEKLSVEELLRLKIHKLQETKVELKELVTEMENVTVANLTKELQDHKVLSLEKDALFESAQQKHMNLEKVVATRDASIREYELHLQRLQNEAKTASQNASAKEAANATALSDAESHLAAAMEEESKLRIMSEELSLEVHQLKDQLSISDAQIKKLTLETMDLRDSVDQLQSSRDQFEQENTDLRNTLETTTLAHAFQLEKREQENVKLLEALEKATAQVTTATKRAEEAEQKAGEAVEANTRCDKEARSVQEALRDDLAATHGKLIESEKAVVEEQQRLSEAIAELTQVRKDAVVAYEAALLDKAEMERRLAVKESQLSEVQGDMLELELKLDHSSDERKALMERVIGAEDQCSRLREKLTEQHLANENVQIALRDLGRENQLLQMTQDRVQQRKWLPDEDATSCVGCQSTFSVTVRKHHCRNCGVIFCANCSSKTAILTASRKAVRVCDACHHELMKNCRQAIRLNSTNSTK